MGFITNAAQEKQLASDDFQNQIVQALVNAISHFRDARGAAAPSGGAR
jgi:N-acetylmuramoyl-L-alanine amidase